MGSRIGWCLVLLPVVAAGASLRPEAIGVRVQRAHRVVRARVSGSVVLFQNNDPRRLYTLTRLEVLETLKGPPSSELELFQLGGRAGKWELKLAGDPELKAGEEAVFLVRCQDPKLPQRCTLVALAEGRLPVLRSSDAVGFEVILPGGVRRTWAAFAKEVRAHAALPTVDPVTGPAQGGKP